MLSEAPQVANGFVLPSAAISFSDLNSLSVRAISTRGRRGCSVSLRRRRGSGGKAITARVSSSASRSSSMDGGDSDDDEDLLVSVLVERTGDTAGDVSMCVLFEIPPQKLS